MKWVVTDTKYLTKPSKDWQPHIPTANTDTAYIEVLFRTDIYTFSISILVIQQNLIDFSASVLYKKLKVDDTLSCKRLRKNM